MSDLRKVLVLIGVACLCTAMTTAQEQTKEKVQSGPYPAIGAEDSASKPDRDAVNTVVSDSSPVTGIQAMTLGHSSQYHSFLQPGFSFAESVDTNPVYV